jgi:F0F1-type ATP synthase assembly protein I
VRGNLGNPGGHLGAGGWLDLPSADPNANFGAALVVGEFLKVLLVAGLFALAYSRGGGVHALALLLGFIAAVQGYFLALLLPDR